MIRFTPRELTDRSTPAEHLGPRQREDERQRKRNRRRAFEPDLHLQDRLIQERDLPGSDLSVQDADTKLFADRSAVYFEDMLETAALETGDAGVVNKVVLEEKDEVHSEILVKF